MRREDTSELVALLEAKSVELRLVSIELVAPVELVDALLAPMVLLEELALRSDELELGELDDDDFEVGLVLAMVELLSVGRDVSVELVDALLAPIVLLEELVLRSDELERGELDGDEFEVGLVLAIVELLSVGRDVSVELELVLGVLAFVVSARPAVLLVPTEESVVAVVSFALALLEFGLA